LVISSRPSLASSSSGSTPSAGRVVVGAQVADGLVDGPVDGLLGAHRFVVDGDLVLPGVDLEAEVGDGPAVDLDPAGGDEGVAVPARADPGVG
jgi:hypothetical protein